MSEVKVNKISPRSGTGVQLGDSGDTITIPSGATITNSGTASGFGDNLEWQSSIVTAATITVVANRGYWLDTSSNAITVTLPGTAAVGDRLIFTDYARNWGTNAVTINQNSLKFQGGTDNPVYDTNGQSVDIVYSGTTKGWIPNSDDDVADEGTIVTFDIEYLLVAGGGSGGGSNAGGGGAGGLLTNYGGTAIALSEGTAYTVTVGGGGAAADTNDGSNGENSVLSGTGITTITSDGGGGGGNGGRVGLDGGSGGGAGNGQDGGSATSGQGNDGGSGSASAPAYGGGGGGGKGAVGADGTANAGGNGGNGLANSITGSAVTYAGGGGGATDPGGTQGTGGSGGGGTGIQYSYGSPVYATSGTNGLGGGGGASGGGVAVSGAGGTGVVILRIATAEYTGTVTGSPTVTTDGSDTIIKFTGTGTYTA